MFHQHFSFALLGPRPPHLHPPFKALAHPLPGGAAAARYVARGRTSCLEVGPAGVGVAEGELRHGVMYIDARAMCLFIQKGIWVYPSKPATGWVNKYHYFRERPATEPLSSTAT